MKFVFREMPDMQKTGERKVYPAVFHGATIPYDTIVSLMANVTRLSRTAIESVFIEFADVLSDYLANGHAVKIDRLGTFDLALGMKDGVKAERLKKKGARYNTRDVQVKGINFLPDAAWLRRLRKDVTFERVGTATITKVTTTVEERRQMALAYLEENDFLTVKAYAWETGLCRTKANQELNAFCEDPTSGIRSIGARSHKVYVRSSSFNSRR